MICDVCGRTDEECKVRKIKDMFLCSKHLTQYYRHGTFLKETIYDANIIELFDDHAEIVLKDKHCVEVGRALIDLEDVEKCSKYKWYLRRSRNTNYAISSAGVNNKIFLHRLVLGYDGELDIDHKDRNGLNNRKYNLTICDHSQNLTNQGDHRKGIKAVPSGRFQAHITHNYKDIYLGTYDTYSDALAARKAKEKELFHD